MAASDVAWARCCSVSEEKNEAGDHDYAAPDAEESTDEPCGEAEGGPSGDVLHQGIVGAG